VKEIFVVVFVLGFFIGGNLLTGWVIMALWNFLFPGLLGLPLINFGQGLAISLLLSIVGSFFKSSK
jgi:hypothetical protein